MLIARNWIKTHVLSLAHLINKWALITWTNTKMLVVWLGRNVECVAWARKITFDEKKTRNSSPISWSAPKGMSFHTIKDSISALLITNSSSSWYDQEPAMIKKAINCPRFIALNLFWEKVWGRFKLAHAEHISRWANFSYRSIKTTTTLWNENEYRLFSYYSRYCEIRNSLIFKAFYNISYVFSVLPSFLYFPFHFLANLSLRLFLFIYLFKSIFFKRITNVIYNW